MPSLVVFDDAYDRLSPLTDLRASFELRTGAVTTLERIERSVGRPVSAVVVPRCLVELTRARLSAEVNKLPDDDAMLLVNGRWSVMHAAPPDRVNTAVLDAHGAVAAALLDLAKAAEFVAEPMRLPDGVDAVTDEQADLLRQPWHVIQHAKANLPGDIEAFEGKPLQADDPTVVIAGDHPVLVGQGAQIGPHVVFDTAGGAVAIDSGARIEPMTTLQGPCYIGPDSVVIRHGDIRANTVVGPVCKVGGEVSGTVIQGFSNKAHLGFVGDSYLGEWVNLGAGTTTSNLKNTYGEVAMQTDPAGDPEPTGMPFLGAILGDHVKTAIGTRLNTGACVHSGAMVAVSNFPPKCIGRFAFLTDAGEQKYDLGRFVEVADRMMHRRGQQVTEALRTRLAELHVG